MTREASHLSTGLVNILEKWSPSSEFVTTVELKHLDEILKITFRPSACEACKCRCNEEKAELAKSFSEKLSEVQRQHRSGEMSLISYLKASSEIWDAARAGDVEVELGVVRGDVIQR